MGTSAPARCCTIQWSLQRCIFQPLFRFNASSTFYFFLLLFKLTLLFEFYKYIYLNNPPHFIVAQGLGITALCLLMSACTAGECVHSRCAHACTPLVREQCVMVLAERWCVKRCNVFARRRCQHHGPLSWPGFLTQRFLSPLIGPDTNFLAKLQCGRYNLIADPHPTYTDAHKHTETRASQQLCWLSNHSSSLLQTTAGRHLLSASLLIGQHTLTHCVPSFAKLLFRFFFREQASREDFSKHSSQVFPLALSHFNVLYVANMLLMLCSYPYFCLCIPISCSGKRVSVVNWLVTCGCINI